MSKRRTAHQPVVRNPFIADRQDWAPLESNDEVEVTIHGHSPYVGRIDTMTTDLRVVWVVPVHGYGHDRRAFHHQDHVQIKQLA